MRVIFMGTPEFAVASAEAVRCSSHEIAAVVTVPDKPQGRGLAMRGSAMKEWALRYDLPLLQPASLRDPQFEASVRALAPDCIVVVAFQILPRSIFTIPARGAFNLHASLLPKYRGAAPINWAIINGERETGVTTFFLKEAVDTGTMIHQERCAIGDEETAGELHDRLAALGASVVVRTLDDISAGTARTTPQDDALACPAPKLTPENCRIDWHLPAAQVHNLVRGLSPHPGAWTTHDGARVKLFRTRLRTHPAAGAPGTIAVVEGAPCVRCGDGWIEMLEAQSEGRKRIEGSKYVQGHLINEGDRFV